MKNEFIPYTQSLALKELGFDKPCFGFYNNADGNVWIKHTVDESINIIYTGDFEAPTFSQAFRWFREKYDLIACNDYGSNEYFYWIVSKDEEFFFNNDEDENTICYKTYEEAELACIDKLIEILKQRNNGK